MWPNKGAYCEGPALHVTDLNANAKAVKEVHTDNRKNLFFHRARKSTLAPTSMGHMPRP